MGADTMSLESAPNGLELTMRNTSMNEVERSATLTSAESYIETFYFNPERKGIDVETEWTRGTLNGTEWDEVLQTIEMLEHPTSPVMTECMDGVFSEELEVTGLEFLQSPMISTKSNFSLTCTKGEKSSTLPSLQTLDPFDSAFTNNSRDDDSSSLRIQFRLRSQRTDHDFGTKARKASRILDFDEEQDTCESNMRSSKRQRRTMRKGSSMRRRGKSERKSKICCMDGCTKGARSKGLCKRHGGGKRCTHPDCTRSDQGGGFCIAHGGGRRCAIPHCKNSAQSRGLCKSHGGGKRCGVEGCIKSSQEGGVCRGHGGGKICKMYQCSRSRASRQKYCLLHMEMS
uniref:Uncharacterized protein AlNc14C10G1248 n=1 Tax=Albugo laibachii Nc14 TaxID=890382 RepID=F0W2K1_9STRA|nr:conserved hypothetical protein [Albugo laibachii Nc14]|eukprot:CCA15287.1 conserved hypothetical protein [Albugo laibachii Nc14]